MDRKLLELLVCPITKTGLIYDTKAQELISERAKLAYPITNDIPNMIAEDARPLTDKEIAKIKSRL